MRRIISILMENEPGALSRVIGLFSQRGYNIESLSVAPTEDSTLSRLTLTTFRDIPWNAPYYERLGYRQVPQAEVGGGLARIFALERHADGDGRNRIAMRKALR